MSSYLKTVFLLAGTAILSACGSNAVTPEPGEYQQTVKITTLDFPGIEGDGKAQMIEQMEGLSSGPASKFCMDVEQGANQWKEAASQMAGALGGNCDTIRDEGSANTLDLEMLCKGTARGDVTVKMTGTARSDGYDSNMSFDMADPKTKTKAKLAMDIGANRVGDCAD
ncbi:MAG: DUF3617 family protein [Parasphingorhabdus sp.]|uniref:DUF3617 domain-containing protein n=1 Tax=Parasphingorhabdus sp. TaxID=2709688 RepID=UPI003297D027